jgi:hypothetical protein
MGLLGGLKKRIENDKKILTNGIICDNIMINKK